MGSAWHAEFDGALMECSFDTLVNVNARLKAPRGFTDSIEGVVIPMTLKFEDGRLSAIDLGVNADYTVEIPGTGKPYLTCKMDDTDKRRHD